MVFNEKGDPKFKNEEMILVNPTIISKSPEFDTKEEGCLSFPQIRGDVQRSIWVEVRYADIAGSIKEVKFEGLPARIFQHEYDHLDKVTTTLMIDNNNNNNKV